MRGSALLVDEDDDRRRRMARDLARRGIRHLDVADAFAAMGALGRADFGVVLAQEGRRMLSLRGLCQLARRHHPDIQIFVVRRAESDPAAIPAVLGADVKVLDPSLDMDEAAALIERALEASASATGAVIPDGGQARDDEPTQKNPARWAVPQT